MGADSNSALETFETLVDALGVENALKAVTILDGTASPRRKTIEVALKRREFCDIVRKFPKSSVRMIARRMGVAPRTIRRWRDDLAANGGQPLVETELRIDPKRLAEEEIVAPPSFPKKPSTKDHDVPLKGDGTIDYNALVMDDRMIRIGHRAWAYWTCSGHRIKAEGAVVRVTDKSVSIKLTADITVGESAWAAGTVITVPRIHNHKNWSVSHRVALARPIIVTAERSGAHALPAPHLHRVP